MLESFDHITDDFYKESGMHSEKVILEDWLRESAPDDERRVKFLQRLIENKAVLDFGCGNGGFLIKASKYATLVEGVEVERSLKAHFKRNRLHVYENLGEIKRKYDVITAFHVIEHMKDPAALLAELANLLTAGGIIIIEVPNSEDALLSLYKCRAFSEFTYWSCHLFLFNNNNLEMLVEKAELKLVFIKQIQRYPLSNHLYWLAHGRPGGHQKWGFLDSEDLHVAYEKTLASLGICDTIIAGVSK